MFSVVSIETSVFNLLFSLIDKKKSTIDDFYEKEIWSVVAFDVFLCCSFSVSFLGVD